MHSQDGQPEAFSRKNEPQQALIWLDSEEFLSPGYNVGAQPETRKKLQQLFQNLKIDIIISGIRARLADFAFIEISIDAPRKWICRFVNLIIKLCGHVK